MNYLKHKLFVLHGLLEENPAGGVVTSEEDEPSSTDDFEAKYGLGDEDDGVGETPSAEGGEVPPPSSPLTAAADSVVEPASPHPVTPEPKEEQPPAQPPAAPAAAKKDENPPPAQSAAQPTEPAAKPQDGSASKVLSEEQQLANLQEYYKLSDDDAAALQTEQEVVIPKLAAKLHYSVMQDLGAWMAQAVPQMIQRHNVAMQRETEARNRIFSRWPDLKDYEDQTLQAGALFRQMNPNATPEQVLDAIGAIVYAGLGKPLPGASAPAAPAPAPTQPPGTFMPAAPAAGTAPAPAAPAPNSIQSLVDDDLAEGYRPAGR